MAAIPFMPLYVADYLADAAHLSTTEHGAYLLLIMTYWQRGEPLPNDDKKLARICRVGPREWKRMKPVLSEFFEVDCNTWFHSRVQSELQKVHDKSLKKRKAGLARAKQMLSTRSADVQLSDTDTDSVSKDTGASANSDKDFWDTAVNYLGPKSRSMIGKWCKDYGRSETAKAITAAQMERVVDPVAYITKCLRKAGNRDKNGWQMPIC